MAPPGTIRTRVGAGCHPGSPLLQRPASFSVCLLHSKASSEVSWVYFRGNFLPFFGRFHFFSGKSVLSSLFGKGK